MKIIAIFVCAFFIVELTSAAVVCPAGYEGPVIRGCNDRGMKCNCEKDGSVACVPLCPLSQPPFDDCHKEYLPPTYRRNLTTGEGCCSDWVCPGHFDWDGVRKECGNETKVIYRDCMAQVPLKCYCSVEDGLMGCTDMCPIGSEFDRKVCKLIKQTGIPWNTHEGCCPKIWCPWDEGREEDGVDDSYLV